MRRRGVGRRGPGLAGTMARTAVVAGTATAVSGSMQRSRQARETAAANQQQAAIDTAVAEQLAQQPAAPPAAAAGPSPDTIAALKELGALRDSGVLTEKEFAAQKAKLLG